jgi:hypothetical protein
MLQSLAGAPTYSEQQDTPNTQTQTEDAPAAQVGLGTAYVRGALCEC